MKYSSEKITCGDFKALRKITALTGITGKWTKTKNHCAYRTEIGAVLNYWKSTGTILFQGRELPAAELTTAFLRRAVIIQKH
jgi:hypothetical protein